MRKQNSNPNQLMLIKQFMLSVTAVALFCSSCASTKPVDSFNYYRFNLDGNTYRLHSVISADKEQSFIRLISETFLAFDYDMDGVIDRITLGDATLQEAQKIYNAGIMQAKRENRLTVKSAGNGKYTYESYDFTYQLKSYQPENSTPFNEIKIVDKRKLVETNAVIALDENADGTLEQILLGKGRFADIQDAYDKVIERGLKEGKLIKVDGRILVKDR
jgi:hypothetical protein